MIKEITLKTIGLGLESFGKLSKKSHLKSFGHYIACKEDITLDKKVLEKVKEFLLMGFDFNVDEMRKNLRDWKYFDPVDFDIELHRTLGKFQVKLEEDKILVRDYYIFYRWCGNPQHDSENCDCPEEDKIWPWLELFNIHGSFHHELYYKFLQIDDEGISIGVSNDFFAKIGKPYWQTGEIEL